MWYKNEGELYAHKGNTFTKSHPFWMVLQCHKSIMFWYLDQIQRAGYAVSTPLAGSHVSVVRREKITDVTAWKAAIGETISFEYLPQVKTNGKHWWLPVRAPELVSKRLSFGLRGTPRVPFHLTVAVATEDERPPRKIATKEVSRQVELLRAKQAALPSELWDSSHERLELETILQRFELR